jgi:ribosomal protein S24E
MKADITSERYNPFLKRKELVISIENPAEPTPRKAALQQLIAKQTKRDVENVEVLDVFSGSGAPKSIARVHVWDEKKVPDLSKPAEKEGNIEEKKGE